MLHDKNKIRKRAEEKREWERRERAKLKFKERKPRKVSVVGHIPEDFLRKLYIAEKKSMREIAGVCSCSVHKVAYWITAYSIPVRGQSEAVHYARNKIITPSSFKEKEVDVENASFMYGLGLGLYWGAGAQSGNAIRMGSENPKIINAFIYFLSSAYGVKKDSLRFGLRVPRDTNMNDALVFWMDTLSVSRAQFQKPFISKTHKKRSDNNVNGYGFITLYFYNSKLKHTIRNVIERRILP